METAQAVQWLKQQGLFEESEIISNQIKNVFSACLNIKDEKVLVIGDTGLNTNKRVAALLSGAYYLASTKFNFDTKFLFQSPKTRGDKAEEHIVTALKDLPEGNIVILNMSDKLGSIEELGKSFRKWVKKRKHRFVSAMSLGDLENGKINNIVEAMDVSYKPFQANHKKVREILDACNEVHVKSKAGTDLKFNIEGINAIAADGNYSEPGSGGNLPAGEVYAAPNGKNVNGIIVVDGSARVHNGTILIKEPITIKVEEGTITEITGGEEADELRKTIDGAAKNAKHPGSVRRICELGIGLNPKAKLIGATIIDEKVLGTAHVGIGSNYWFGGTIYATIHLDQVLKDVEIFCDGKKLDV